MNLRALFESDPRLRKTIPLSYEIDQEKLAAWNAKNEWNRTMNPVKVSFDQLLTGLEKGFHHCLSLMKKGVHFLCSDGSGLESNGSASEKWLFYAACLFFRSHGVTVHPHENGFERFYFEHLEESGLRFLFIDDFINSGYHVLDRILGADALFYEDRECPIVEVVVGAGDEAFEFEGEMFSDLMMERPTMRKFHLGQIELFVGHQFKRGFEDPLFLEHKCLVDIYDDFYCGFTGKETLGPLIKGWECNVFQYPPALYHLEFGCGELPLWPPMYMEKFAPSVCTTVTYPGTFQETKSHVDFEISKLLEFSTLAEGMLACKGELLHYLAFEDHNTRFNKIVYEIWEALDDQNEKMAAYLGLPLSVIEQKCGESLGDKENWLVPEFVRRTNLIRVVLDRYLEELLQEA